MKDAPRRRLAAAFALVMLALAVALTPTDSWSQIDDPLTLVLAVAAFAGLMTTTPWAATLNISAAFACQMIAVALLGAAPAIAIGIIAEAAAWAVERYRPVALISNIASAALPVAVASLLYSAVAEVGSSDARALTALAISSTVALVGNWLLISSVHALVDRLPWRTALHHPTAMLPGLALTIGFVLTLTASYEELGLAAAAFVLLLVVAFSYLTRLLVNAQDQTRQYAALSWGVLSSLLRTLDQRDRRAARHSAAVAAFSRDIAEHVGLDERQQELAHTSGLLHDIGKFAFTDRILEPGHHLTENDWQAVRRHPAIGADLLPDLRVYGPVAEIVRAHHERIDGRGYPDGLQGDDIPELARIVAVAEAYDTLTAEDTYRAQMTSFEALTELRRVAGSQLDGRFVEALAELLTGRGVEYRHADAADFDEELAIERRIADAVS